MKPVEKIDCMACQRPVLLSYVPTRDATLTDSWTCPYTDCRMKHPSSRKGHLVIAVPNTRA